MHFAPRQREHRFQGHAGQEAPAAALAFGAAFRDDIGFADVLQALDAHADQGDLREGGPGLVIHPDRLSRFAIGADHAPDAPAGRRGRRLFDGDPFAGGADFPQPSGGVVGRLGLQDAASLDLPAGQDIVDDGAIES
ncbi:hypothetical protein AKI39_20120 [Bordetella sp. H567]|nr:hypothetical protein AKI39_20120 [Bordetella sp. H567]